MVTLIMNISQVQYWNNEIVFESIRTISFDIRYKQTDRLSSYCRLYLDTFSNEYGWTVVLNHFECIDQS